MRATDWKRVVRPLLPDDAWAFHGRAVHRTPVRHVAIGLLAEGSGWSTGVHLWRLRLPLFVPGEDWTLDWSERLGGGSHTYSADDEDELHRAISHALSHTADEHEALAGIAEPSRQVNWRMLEEVVGSRVLLGQAGEGDRGGTRDRPRTPQLTTRLLGGVRGTRRSPAAGTEQTGGAPLPRWISG